MNLFVSYLILGLSLAAPIGPVNALQLERGMKNGFLHSWFVGIGAMTADGIFMLIIFFGLVHFLSIPFLQAFLWLFGCFVLIYTGFESLINAKKININEVRHKESLWNSYLSGFLISLFNPLSILFWLGIYGSILSSTINHVGLNHLLYYTAAIFIGLSIWDFSMATISSMFRKYFATKFISFLSVISGLSLIGFGIYFGYEGIKVLITK